MGRDVALSHAVMRDGMVATRADGERSGVRTLCNLFVLRNKALSLYSVRLIISTPTKPHFRARTFISIRCMTSRLGRLICTCTKELYIDHHV